MCHMEKQGHSADCRVLLGRVHLGVIKLGMSTKWKSDHLDKNPNSYDTCELQSVRLKGGILFFFLCLLYTACISNVVDHNCKRGLQ